MASLTRWTWVWVNSRSWWWTRKPGVLQSMGPQRARHSWPTGLTDWWEFVTKVCLSVLRITHSSIHAWKIPWTEEPGGLQPMGSQRVGHDCTTSLHFTSLHFCDKSQSSLELRLSSGEGAYGTWVPFGCLQVNESSVNLSLRLMFSNCMQLKIISTPEWHILGQYVLNSNRHIFYYPSRSIQSFCLFLFSLPYPYGELWELHWASS